MVKKSEISQLAPFNETLVIKKDLDLEWVELIKEARRYGITIEEIRKFLRKNRNKV